MKPVKGYLSALIGFFLPIIASAQGIPDPLPYAQIANPLPDTMDQLYRDSVNLKISRVRVNQAGYRPQDSKYFYYIANGAASSYKVIDASGSTVTTGSLTSTNQTSSGQLRIKASNNAQLITGGDTRYIMESPEISGTVFEGLLPDLAPGRYRVIVNSDTSADFVIDERLYSWVRDALLKFYGVNRCGDTHSWFHGACHLKDAVTGGWHDCGDHLKEASTQGYTAAVLGLAAAVFQDRDQDVYGANHSHTVITDGIPDILYEAKHGADYILQSYEKANGQVASMITSVGDFGRDHQWWGRPEYQDNMPVGRGGPPRAARSDPASDVLGDFAADLAFVSKLYRRYDAEYSDRCLQAAIALYEYGKAQQTLATSEAYHGQTTYNDDMAFAALALLWATGERKYLDELCFDPVIGSKASATAFPKALFEGGWFAHYDPLFYHGFANTDWGSTQMYVLWGFFRLVLNDPQFCESLGLTEAQRLALIEKTAYNALTNLSSVALGTQTIEVPSSGIWVNSIIKYELPWFTMHTQMEWVWNRYQSGNITDMYCYYDIASKIQGMELPYTPASTDWKAQEVKEIMIRQLDYMLGVNPWDISMIYGIGNKNFNHPHHRAANPEGKNVPGAFYRYRPPVGALQGGYMPGTSLYSEHYDDWFHSETGIDGTTNLMIPVTGLAKEELLGPPSAVVKILYVGCTEAIIEVRQSRYGTSTIRYGAGETPSGQISSDSSGITHRIQLTNLSEGTLYSFDVLVADLYGRDSVIKSLDEDKVPVYFTFKTLSTCPQDAQITKVKVCKVTSDSAEIFWYTPNGEFDSKIVYGTSIPPTTVQSGDISGHPVKFHYMKIGGLQEKTTYYFYVQSGNTIDNNGGQYYQFTTPVEHVNFDVRALRYEWGGKPALGINVVNQDSKAYDSLDLRFYFRAKEGFENDLAFRLDIGIVYEESGYQKDFDSLGTAIRNAISSQRPVKMEETFNAADGTYAYWLSLPLWGVQMKSGSRIRVDIIIDRRSRNFPYEDLMDQAPDHIITDADWSFGPHSRANGDPVDFSGIPIGNKDATDSDYWNLEVNQYITVYRKGEFIWGYSPSYQEQQTKKTHYEMVTQITAPLNNPSQDFIRIERATRSVDVTGWAKVTPIDGAVNDIWVNGVTVPNLSQILRWNEAEMRYDFTISVPLPKDNNPIDVTIFGGPPELCTDCYGCAASNHTFYVEFQGAKQYPSTLTLTDLSMQILEDTARIDTTVFHVIVTDRNGNINKSGPDTLYVSVTNPVAGDSIRVMLIETGDSTNTFQTVTPVSVVSLPASQTSGNQISMSGGDKIWITYIDPTDPTDVSEAFLVSKAEFPVALRGWLKDTDGDGAVDKMYVEYSKELRAAPDSFSFSFPEPSTVRIARTPGDSMEILGSTIVAVDLRPPLTQGATGFINSQTGQGKSYLLHQGITRISAFQIQDSAGPALLGSVLLYEKTESGSDTLTITFTETINVSTLIGDVLLLRKNGTDYPITVQGIIGAVPGTNTLTLIIESGSVQIEENDSVSIDAGGILTDLPGNRAHAQNRPVPVVLKAAPPQILAAWYKDSDYNGMIDLVEITFSKSIALDELKVWLSWNGGIRVPISNSVAGYNDAGQRFGFRIEGLLTGAAIITAGTMDLSAVYMAFSGDTMRASVADSAAPVIVSAVYAPSSDISGNSKDTLTVSFSEPVVSVISEQPFLLFSPDSGKQYSFKLENSRKGDAQNQIFLVKSVEDIPFPGNNDSIWINPLGGIFDNNGLIQNSPANRRVQLQVKPMPFSVIIDAGPNPLYINSSLTGNDPDFPAAWQGQSGILFRISPIARVKIESNLSGRVDIHDALGNIVYTGDIVPGSGENSNRYFFWNGSNKKRRFVGSGTYIAFVYVTDENGKRTVAKHHIGVSR